LRSRSTGFSIAAVARMPIANAVPYLSAAACGVADSGSIPSASSATAAANTCQM
jgi:hypothetical protein